MKIAKIIKSVMAITELKKIAKKEIQAQSKLLKLLELLGYLFGCCFGIFWLKLETLSANVPDRTR